MSWNLKLERELYEEMQSYLWANELKENGCFLVAKELGRTLFVQEVIYPKGDDWIRREEDFCSPSAKYMSYAANFAESRSLALIFVHTHPAQDHPSGFSLLDEKSNAEMFNNLGQIVSKALGSLVVSRNGIHGVIWSDEKCFSIANYTVLGKHVRILRDVKQSETEVDFELFDRQILFMKKAGLQTLSSLNIAIVGLGGIGSPIACMLARMGVERMTFIDGDLVEKHNIPRIQGAKFTDIGKHKVEVVANHIKGFSTCEVNLVKDMLSEDSTLDNFDVLFGCVDNHTCRNILNRASYTYAIPYIDAACAIPLSDDGEVAQAVISVSTVLPKTNCLWCNNTLDAMKILQESLTEEEMEQRILDGYQANITETPSVVSLTTSVGGFAVNRLLNLINVYKGEYPNKVIFDFDSTMIVEKNVIPNESCQCKRNNPFKRFKNS